MRHMLISSEIFMLLTVWAVISRDEQFATKFSLEIEKKLISFDVQIALKVNQSRN